MIRSFDGKSPRIDASVYVAEEATIIGDVELGEGSSVWPGAVIRGDGPPIRIGKQVHVEDNVVIHSGEGLTIGDKVFIGHGCIIHGVSIGSNGLISNGSILLEGSVVGSSCIISAGSVVVPRMVIPDHSFVEGRPAKIVGRPTLEQLGRIPRGLEIYRELIARYRRG